MNTTAPEMIQQDQETSGGIVLGYTDQTSAHTLALDDAVLIDLRLPTEQNRNPLAGAIPATAKSVWHPRVTAAPQRWVLLNGGSPAARHRLLTSLPDQCPVLIVLPRNPSVWEDHDRPAESITVSPKEQADSRS